MQNILLIRLKPIGDVVLTLPAAGLFREYIAPQGFRGEMPGLIPAGFHTGHAFLKSANFWELRARPPAGRSDHKQQS
jgi:hypothetical protein